MDPEKLKEMKKYMKPSFGWVVLGSLLILFGVATITAMGWIVLLYLATGGILLWVGISGRTDVEKRVKELEARGELERVLADFAGSKSFAKDKIRMGNYYIYGKNQQNLVRYEDIRQVYQSIRKRNGSETSRTLQYVNAQGKTLTLCNLQLKDKSHDDMMQIMMIIKAKNLAVKLGYQ